MPFANNKQTVVIQRMCIESVGTGDQKQGQIKSGTGSLILRTRSENEVFLTETLTLFETIIKSFPPKSRNVSECFLILAVGSDEKNAYFQVSSLSKKF